jgi:dUTP pyrophosphatase
MNKLKVKIRKLAKHAKIPQYIKNGDAGMDLYAVDYLYNHDYNFHEYGTGLAMQIPEGYVGLVFPRSSISKTPYSLCNSVGMIDSSYTGEIKLRFKDIELDKEHNQYMVGDRIGQIIIMPYPQVAFVEVDELDKTDRGSGGFGSTGR